MAETQGKAIRPDKVAIYIRWSTEEQSDGTTLAEQREGCEFYVRSQGWFINPSLIFIDDGYSGGNLDRPAMRQLRELVRKGDVDCAVVLKIDRLSRNIVDATQLVLNEWAGKCHLRCVRQPIDTTSETGRMFFAILATFADFERAQITERTTQGRVRRISEGKAYGSRVIPYGLLATNQPGVRVIDPEKAMVVAELFRKVREESANPNDLRVWLNESKISPPEGDEWHLNTIRRLLRNPIYAGRIVYGKTMAKKKEGRTTAYLEKRDKPLVEVPAATVPAVVSPEVFDEVQAILADRTAFHAKHRRASSSTHLLTGIARCRCGATMNIHWSKGKRYYQCTRKMSFGYEGCSAACGNLPVEPIDEAVVADLLRSFGQHRDQAEAVRISTRSAKDTQSLEKERTKVQAELQRVDKRIGELRELASMGDLSLSEWRTLNETAEGKRADIEQRLTDIQAKLGRALAGATHSRLLEEQVRRLDRWHDLSLPEQKELLGALAESIQLYKPKGYNSRYEIEVVWRF